MEALTFDELIRREKQMRSRYRRVVRISARMAYRATNLPVSSALQEMQHVTGELLRVLQEGEVAGIRSDLMQQNGIAGSPRSLGFVD